MDKDIDFVTTAKGARALIVDHFKYVKIRASKDEKVYWRCADNKTTKCTAKSSTMSEQLMAMLGYHNHSPDIGKIVVERAVTEMRKRAVDETKPMPRIYEDVVEEVARKQNGEVREFAASIPTFDTVKNYLYRTRHTKYPKLPKEISDMFYWGMDKNS